MSIAKSDTLATLKSARWSTTELSDGLAHLLVDMQGELPNDLALLTESQRRKGWVDEYSEGSRIYIPFPM